MAQPTPPWRPDYARRYRLALTALGLTILCGLFLVARVHSKSFERGFQEGQAHAAAHSGERATTPSSPNSEDPFLEQMRKFREEQEARRAKEAK